MVWSLVVGELDVGQDRGAVFVVGGVDVETYGYEVSNEFL